MTRVRASLLAASMVVAVVVAPAPRLSAQTVGDVFYSMSVGWISARWGANTVYKQMPLADFFQTTATINQGNSGGPMFDIAGEVIGIVSHNISKSGGSEGLGFIPVGYLASYEKIRDELRRLGPGATLTVTILRAGQIKDLSGRMSR